MFRRRRRRNQGTWLPVLGTVPADSDCDKLSHFTMQLEVPQTGPCGSIFGILPVVFDTPQEPDALANTDALTDLVGNEYFLKRIVGKLHLGIKEQSDTAQHAISFPYYYIATAGFFVARAQDESIAGGSSLPIGGLLYNQYAPQIREVIREPWIWRRSWVLGSAVKDAELRASFGTNFATSQGWPQNNSTYGSIQDGPHVDQKTKRRVRQDERLWFTIQVRSASDWTTTGINSTATLEVVGDFRYFASMRRAKNSGNF